MSNDFDYIEFANEMYKQALELDLMDDYKDIDQHFIANYVKKYALIVGEALNKDSSLEINKDVRRFITQVVIEWIYYKLLDLLKSGISQEILEPIIQKIAFTVFEYTKQGISRNLTQDQLLQVVESHVNKVYNSSLEELLEKNIITKEQYKNATTQSYIDKLCTKKKIELEKNNDKKINLKQMFLSTFLIVACYEILKYTNLAQQCPMSYYIIEKFMIYSIILLLVTIIFIYSKKAFKYIQKLLFKRK